jgi:4-hydroxy-3-methylbut-2-enyl diphosphate reductase
VGARALLVDDAADVPPSALVGARRVGVTAGASAPDELVLRLVDALRGVGSVTVQERSVADEAVRFKLPPEVTRRK